MEFIVVQNRSRHGISNKGKHIMHGEPVTSYIAALEIKRDVEAKIKGPVPAGTVCVYEVRRVL